ncbi:sporulation protein YqfD [Sporosarcina jiandibaonis]|uniref:sporulation protein YqfD n=1 Tax=Sporosarcina jiandibaonis TaxID=2715535 RepID=UPI001552C715|nr:sporulation protein YqfD [Sporosarcina jiandibaonis]
MISKRYTIRISKNKNLTAFLTKLKSLGTTITLLTITDNVVDFRTDRKGVRNVRKYRRRYGLKVKITTTDRDAGLAALFNSFRFLIALIIPLTLSFFLWSVSVESDVPEVAERIEGKLNDASITRFRPLYLIPNEDEIRRNLMQDDPSLSWVRFKREGASLTVIPMLSPASDIDTGGDGPPADLVARTGGMITRFALSRGERKGHTYMTVKKGDILATGTLEQGDKKVVVGAEGAVYADFWVEYKFSLPKRVQYMVQGEEEVEFIFQNPLKSKKLAESWKLFTTKRTINEISTEFELVEGMETTIILELIKNQLLAEYGHEAMIKDNKVLHVSFDNDKVNGTILFLINDNIAMKRPIAKETEANE